MCLIVNKKKKKPATNKYIYKVVRVDVDGELKTPYEHMLVIAGTLKAKGRHARNNIVGKGAIHAYTTLRQAEQCLRYCNDTKVILKCLARPEHFIAYGTRNDVAYSQIEVPKKEYDKHAPAIKAMAIKRLRMEVSDLTQRLALLNKLVAKL